MKNILRIIKDVPEILHRLRISRIVKTNYLVHVKKGTIIIGAKYIHLGKNFCADIDVRIEAWDHHLNEKYTPEIIIGDNVFFNSRTHISAINKMIIGNGVLIGSDVLICDNNHGSTLSFDELNVPPQKRRLFSKGSIIIEDNVWIGDKAVILSGVTIGCGSIIGAGSIITKSIPPFSIVVGNPARIVKCLQ